MFYNMPFYNNFKKSKSMQLEKGNKNFVDNNIYCKINMQV